MPSKQAKSLPLNKIIKSQDFKIKHLSEDALISEADETITPSNVGTELDYLTRFVMLADDHAFDLANIELKRYLDHGLITPVEFMRVINKEEKLGRLTESISEVDDIPNEVFRLALDICAWEVAFRTKKYIKLTVYPDRVIIKHMKVMMKLIEDFFDQFGWPMRDAFIASTKNGYLSGDGDYLLKNTLVDLKASNVTKMQPYWVCQLLLYYTLGFYNNHNKEKIDHLMIYNARTDTVFYIDVADVSLRIC
ncbi:hypothetical protein [Lactobacillus amylovorus]|uniref:hypothetical protein n=1 Tax=Lactobacillus amylovorus TaxID=1604 RepID=UPI00200AFAE2|nr:hypothetical protein [Lactobacillus amylovorus]